MSTPDAENKAVLAGGALIRHVMKKGGRNGHVLSIDDLNEGVLQQRLAKLDSELKDYKEKCTKLYYFFNSARMRMNGIAMRLTSASEIRLSILNICSQRRLKK